jgi:inosose dehydratase
MDRREMMRSVALTAGALWLGQADSLRAAGRRLKIGHTSISWGFGPKAAEPGIRDSAALGYHGYESFDTVLEVYEGEGGLGRLLDRYGIPLVSSYFNANLTNPDVRKEEVAKIVRWGKLLRKYGGKAMVIGPNPVRRAEYDFSAAKPAIVATLNEIGKAAADLGLKATIHQHTDTCVDTRDQVYAVLNEIDTRFVGFGPDVGQLAKAGSDPVAIVKDFASIIRTVHLKDYLGWEHYAGYCPVGRGKIDFPVILDVLEQEAKDLEYAMVELEPPGRNAPMTALETATASKEYLQKLGYVFRS